MSFEGMTGVGGGAFRMAHSQGWRVSTGCWQGPQVLSVWTSSLGCLGVLKTWQLASPKASDPRENKMEAAMSVMTHPWKSYSIVSTVSYCYSGQAYSVGEGTLQGVNTRMWGLLRVIVEAGCHRIEDGVFQMAKGEGLPSTRNNM